ncbi:uncharacterized protein [Clytia hemisphaerica]|uniref:uncharacterized protein isoform X2 n=1 Tax=Clytia hemisphaerica TaxID=252671 RepID=UPI0034D5AAD4
MKYYDWSLVGHMIIMKRFVWFICLLSCYQHVSSKDEKNSGSVKGNELSDTQKVALLQLHNAFRSMVQPSASNMYKMVWDDDLERISKDFAGKCIVAHNPERHKEAKRFDWVGENIAWGTGSCGDKDCGDVYEGVKRWFTESKSYNYDSGECSGKCTLYTQMVWWESNKLGCGAKRCGDRTILVCNYAPGGNYVGQRPYTHGKPCSKCPDNLTCEDNLCVEKTQPSEELMDKTSKKCIQGVCPGSSHQQSCPAPGTCPAMDGCPNTCKLPATTPLPPCPPPGTCPASAHCPNTCLQHHEKTCPPAGTCPAPVGCPDTSCNVVTTNVPLIASTQVAPMAGGNQATNLGPGWTPTQARLMQIDTGMTSLVWGIDETEKAFILSEENTLRPVNPSAITSIRHVTAGEAGVWSIDDSGRIYFRMGTSAYNRRGVEWKAIPGTLKQIDSGPRGTVWGVNRNGHVFRRIGIQNGDLAGTGWERIEGELKYVSCGEFGCWGIRREDDSVCFRKGISETAPQGQQWVPIPGRLRMIESGPNGVTVGLNDDNDVFVRKGIRIDNPQGTEWVRLTIKLLHVTVGDRGVIGIKQDGMVAVHTQLTFAEFQMQSPIPTMPATVIAHHPTTMRPHTKVFHPTSSPMHLPSTTPQLIQEPDDREHDSTATTADFLKKIKQSTVKSKEKTNLNITPDIASKILKLIETKSQSYEKAHKSAAAIDQPKPKSELEEQATPAAQDDTPTAKSTPPETHLKDEENVQVPVIKQHDEETKATSITSHHLPSTEDDVEYPAPKLGMFKLKTQPVATNALEKEPIVRKISTAVATPQSNAPVAQPKPVESVITKTLADSPRPAGPSIMQPVVQRVVQVQPAVQVQSVAPVVQAPIVQNQAPIVQAPPAPVAQIQAPVVQAVPAAAPQAPTITISHELARSCCAVPDSVCAIPRDCAGYIECRGYDGSYKACTRGTVFNPLTNICDNPRNVDCETSKQVTPNMQSQIQQPQAVATSFIQQQQPPQQAFTATTSETEPVSAPVTIDQSQQQPPLITAPPPVVLEAPPVPPPPPPPPAPMVQTYAQPQPVQQIQQSVMAAQPVTAESSNENIQPRVQPPKSDDDGVLREVWFNLGLSPLLTTLTNNPRFPSSPDEYIILDKFEAPPNAGDGYGQRLSTYYKAPLTGNYVFYLACDNECELWMSPDTEEIRSNLVLELKKGHYTSFRQWHKYPDQQTSREIALQQGEYYFLESFMKEGSGGDDLSVGVRLPDGKFELPISSNLFLVPGESSSSSDSVSKPPPVSPSVSAGETVSKPGEEQTSDFIGNTEATSTYRAEDLDPQPQHLVEAILNEKPLLNKLQNEADQDYEATVANNPNNIPGSDMYLRHNPDTNLEPKLSLMESIKRNHIPRNILMNLRKNRTMLSPSSSDKVRSIKRDIKEDSNDDLNRKAKVKLKRALLKRLKYLTHKAVK